jgi:hypothetical protein
MLDAIDRQASDEPGMFLAEPSDDARELARLRTYEELTRELTERLERAGGFADPRLLLEDHRSRGGSDNDVAGD